MPTRLENLVRSLHVVQRPCLTLRESCNKSNLPDHPKLRNRMNLPCGSAPVTRIAWRGIFRFLRMPDVKIQPPFEFTPVVQQLFSQSSFRPIPSSLPSPVAEVRCHLEYCLLVLGSAFSIRYKNVNVAARRNKTISCFGSRVSNIDHITLNSCCLLR